MFAEQLFRFALADRLFCSLNGAHQWLHRFVNVETSSGFILSPVTESTRQSSLPAMLFLPSDAAIKPDQVVSYFINSIQSGTWIETVSTIKSSEYYIMKNQSFTWRLLEWKQKTRAIASWYAKSPALLRIFQPFFERVSLDKKKLCLFYPQPLTRFLSFQNPTLEERSCF